MFPLDPIGIWLSTGEIVLCDHGLHRSWSRHNSPKGRANDFLHFCKLPPGPFPVLIQITIFLIRHYLWNLIMDLSITKSLETCVSKMLFPWVSDQLHSTVICWPVFLIISEETGLQGSTKSNHQAFAVFKAIRSFSISSPTKSISLHWFPIEQNFWEWLQCTRYHQANSSLTWWRKQTLTR